MPLDYEMAELREAKVHLFKGLGYNGRKRSCGN
jgi:hypothetical protein